MERLFNIPMSRILGMEVTCRIAGRETAIKLGLMTANMPIPPSSTAGDTILAFKLLTTSGWYDLKLDLTVKEPSFSVGKLAPWAVEELLYDALGQDEESELFPTHRNRKIRSLEEPKEEEKTA